MIEPIDQMIQAFGLDLEFQTFTVKGIPTFKFDNFYNDTYIIQTQDFRIDLKAQAIKDNNIQEDQIFHINDSTNTYRFKFRVNAPPTFDLK